MVVAVGLVAAPTRGGLADLPQRPPAAAKVSAERTRGSLSALVIFAKFAGQAVGETAKPTWADDLFDPLLPGSFTHFYNEMSRGQLKVTGQVLPRRYSSKAPASAYVAGPGESYGHYGRFNLEILQQADEDADFGRFDNDGSDGLPNSGDDDGYVDVVFINLLTVPEGFFIGRATGFASLGLDGDYISDDASPSGGYIRVRSRFSGFGGTTQRGHVFSVTAGTMCHEFGHVLGLPDLFDQSSVFNGEELVPEEDSAGIGKWGLMGLGTLGWGVEDGPNAFSAWTLMALGWLGRDNGNLVEVSQSLRQVVVEQIDRGGKVYKIPLSPDEYFLVENRQASGSYYNRNIPGGGLLVWHVDERADNDEERHKKVDLVCADGLFADRGYPGEQPDPVAGRDNLDYWSRDGGYAAIHNGNQGDATDPFDGVQITRFAYDTNPGARAHTGATRNLPMGFALDDIRSLGDGRVSLDILLRQPLAGHITSDTTWSGQVDVDGDIVVEPGITLTIAAGTEVTFHLGDRRVGGFDPGRCELIAYGDLVVEGDVAAPVTLRSGAARPGRSDWLGMLLMAGQQPGLEETMATGGLVIDNAQYPLLRSRLPLGRTTWSGPLRVPWDVLVPAGAELVIEGGTAIRFAPEDLGFVGLVPPYVELSVEGAVRIEGMAGRSVIMTVDAFGSSGFWYGLRLLPGAVMEADFLELYRSGYGVIGEVSANGRLRLTDSLFQGLGIAMSLTVFGEAAVARTEVRDALLTGVRVEGTGCLLLAGSSITGCGQEAISLGNCSLEAVATIIEDNGDLEGDDPRSGISAEGGRGQRVLLRQCTIGGNGSHGLDLEGWEGSAEVYDTDIVANRRGGMLVSAVEHLRLEESRIEGNSGGGGQLAGSPIVVRSTRFSGNAGGGLALTDPMAGSTVEASHFLGEGLRIENGGETTISGNTFEGAAIGLETVDATPAVARNRFEGNTTGLLVRGGRVPSRIANNIFVDNQLAARNLAAVALDAEGNYWGTLDSTAIGEMVAGAVDWTPFLKEAPAITAVAEVASGLPSEFALYQSYPNPFNASTAIAFDLAQPGVAQLAVFDVLGRRVRTISSRWLEGGRHLETWDGRDETGRPAGTGVYVYRLRAGALQASGKLLLVR
ncbi:right-handed parallel beta-helix repeat-containing protein [Candidatus Latescibacterota bacterium]